MQICGCLHTRPSVDYKEKKNTLISKMSAASGEIYTVRNFVRELIKRKQIEVNMLGGRCHRSEDEEAEANGNRRERDEIRV